MNRRRFIAAAGLLVPVAGFPGIIMQSGPRRFSAGGGGGFTASGIAGTFDTDSTVTLTGSGFGSTGPTILVFDDGRNGIVGNDLETSGASGPEYGAWTGLTDGGDLPANSWPWWDDTHYVSRGKSSRSVVASDGPGRIGRGVEISFAQRQEIFFSRWWRPSASSPAEMEIGSYKPCWLMYQSGSDSTGAGETQFDVCLPTRGGSASLSFAGNAPVSSDWGFSISNVHVANVWTRSSVWLRGSTNPAKLYHHAVNNVTGTSVDSADITQTLFWNGSSPETFGLLRLSNFLRQSGGYPSWDAWEDDRYVATNPARVEIGDHATYSSCTDVRLCYVSSWSSTSITFNVDPDFDLTGKYIHVTDANNSHVTSIAISAA